MRFVSGNVFIALVYEITCLVLSISFQTCCTYCHYLPGLQDIYILPGIQVYYGNEDTYTK